MKPIFLILFIPLTIACQSQSSETITEYTGIGGFCEGCEAIYEYGDKKLNSIDTLPKFNESEKKLKITGTVFQKDGKSPAENVILYIYHTNSEGIYETRGDEKGWAKRHGFIRGWIETDKTGRYTFYTFRPGAYPGRRTPEHIHITVKEPDKNEYYLDDFLFIDDPILTDDFKENLTNRGGSGLVSPVIHQDYSLVERDIILGLNIPDYP